MFYLLILFMGFFLWYPYIYWNLITNIEVFFLFKFLDKIISTNIFLELTYYLRLIHEQEFCLFANIYFLCIFIFNNDMVIHEQKGLMFKCVWVFINIKRIGLDLIKYNLFVVRIRYFSDFGCCIYITNNVFAFIFACTLVQRFERLVYGSVSEGIFLLSSSNPF